MRKAIIILVCFLLIASGVPLFAHGHWGQHGRHWSANPHHWHGSSTHPAFHGWRGWSRAPGHTPDETPGDDPTKPPDTPQEDPVEKPPADQNEDPGDKGGEETREGMLILNPFDGSFPG